MKRDLIARKIKEARERCCLSQQELAKLMGWKSHASIVAIENGDQDIKTWELLKLANILKVSPESLYSESIEKLPTHPIILWRKKADDPNAVLREEHNIIQHYQDYRLIERLTDSTAFAKRLPQEQCDILSFDTTWANQLAVQIHKRLHLGDYPAHLLANRLEEDYGILLISFPLENGSAACYRDELGSVIVLNEKEVLWRQGFNLAHELFHLITWSPSLIEQVQADKKLFKKNEKLADAFAAALLMPSEMIDLDVREKKLSYSDIVALAMKYRVSKQAMLWRLCYLKLISHETVKAAMADEEFADLDRSNFTNAFLPVRFLGDRFLRLAYLAYEKGRLSKSRLAQMLGVKLRDVREFLSGKGLDLIDDKEIKICNS